MGLAVTATASAMPGTGVDQSSEHTTVPLPRTAQARAAASFEMATTSVTGISSGPFGNAWPQHCTVPFDSSAQEKYPAATAVAPLIPAIVTGVAEFRPEKSVPQQLTVPSASTAQPCDAPAPSAMAVRMP